MYGPTTLTEPAYMYGPTTLTESAYMNGPTTLTESAYMNGPTTLTEPGSRPVPACARCEAPRGSTPPWHDRS